MHYETRIGTLVNNFIVTLAKLFLLSLCRDATHIYCLVKPRKIAQSPWTSTAKHNSVMDSFDVHILHTVSKKSHFYILNNSAKNKPILIIFRTRNPEEMSHQKFISMST